MNDSIKLVCREYPVLPLRELLHELLLEVFEDLLLASLEFLNIHLQEYIYVDELGLLLISGVDFDPLHRLPDPVEPLAVVFLPEPGNEGLCRILLILILQIGDAILAVKEVVFVSEQDGKGMHKEFLQVDVYIWDSQLRVALGMIHIHKSWLQESRQQGKHSCTRPHVPVILQ